MTIFLLKSSGARFTEDAVQARINAGLATVDDFVPEDGTPTPAAVAAAATIFLLKSNGARFSVDAKNARIANGLATEDDFVPEGTAIAATAVAAPAAAAPAPATEPAGTQPSFWKVPSGAVLTAAAAAGYVQRGLCTAADLVPLDANQNPIGGASEVAADVDVPVLPLGIDEFNKNDVVAIAEALGLDTDGSKAAIVARVNALGDEAGTKAAIDALGG